MARQMESEEALIKLEQMYINVADEDSKITVPVAFCPHRSPHRCPFCSVQVFLGYPNPAHMPSANRAKGFAHEAYSCTKPKEAHLTSAFPLQDSSHVGRVKIYDPYVSVVRLLIAAPPLKGY